MAAESGPSGESVGRGALLLAEAIEVLKAEDPAAFAGPAALARSASILAAQQQLEVASGGAVLQVHLTEAWVYVHAGSTRDWLRTQVAGDGGRLARAQGWPALNAGLAGRS